MGLVRRVLDDQEKDGAEVKTQRHPVLKVLTLSHSTGFSSLRDTYYLLACKTRNVDLLSAYSTLQNFANVNLLAQTLLRQITSLLKQFSQS